MESGILRDTLSRKPAGTLYHYTTQKGLLGILSCNEIWATHTQYLNDTREYRHAIGVVTDEIDKRLDGACGDGRRILEDMAESVRGGLWGLGDQWVNVCVISFSEDPDSLSLWRAYGGAHSGYAIGFNPIHLADMVRREEFYLAKCLYEPKEQTDVIQALLDMVFKRNMERFSRGEPTLHPGGDLAFYLHHYAPILKDKSFSTENEWRIISPPLPCTREQFDFRCGNSMLIPYYRMPIAQADQPLKLDKIVVGPTPHVEEAVGSVQGLLTRKALGKVPVAHSAVPYRNW
jgi:hypothetical protein